MSSNASSDDHDQCSDHHSPHAAPDEQPPLASSNSHHGEQIGPSAMSSQQFAASSSTHDHEKDGPLTMTSHHDEQPTVDPDQHEALVPDQQACDDQHVSELVEAAPLTEQASTSTVIDDVPPGDP